GAGDVGAAGRDVPQPAAGRCPGRLGRHQLGGQFRRHAHLPGAAEGGRSCRGLWAVRVGRRGFPVLCVDRRARDEGQDTGTDVATARGTKSFGVPTSPRKSYMNVLLLLLAVPSEEVRKGTRDMTSMIAPFLTDYDLYLLGEGNHYRIYEKLGAHVSERDGTAGSHFAVWAPNAKQVSVIGDFNGWRRDQQLLQLRGSSGIWEGFIPDIGPGALYKYAITSRY